MALVSVLAQLSGWRRHVVSAVLGGIAALGHAPFDLWMLTPFALAGVMVIASTVPAKDQLGLSLWAAGTAYFAVSLHWIVEPFLVDAASFGWMAPFALALMAGGLALFWGAVGALAGWLLAPGTARLWALAGLLVWAEYLRATVLTGFPWAHPGHVLIGSELLAISALVGPHGLNALVLFSAALIAWAALRTGLIAGLAAALPLLVLGVMPLTPQAPLADRDAAVIRLIQPNAPQDQKWLPEMIPIFFQRGLDLTASGTLNGNPWPDLIIWPETSLPQLLDRSDVARARLSDAAGGAHVIVGAQRIDGMRARNTMAVLDEFGVIAAVYDKHHLVPFGEYLPFDTVMNRLGLRALAARLPNGFRPGAGPAALDLPGGLGRAFAMICYEAIFPGYIRRVDRPDWMVHVTNDAWFGSFSGPYQHLALARLRAAEQGLPVLRAANTGVSAVIDARGQVVQALPLNDAGFLDARLPPALPPTLYARTGDWPVLFIVFLATAWIIARGRRLPPLHRRS